MPVTRGTFSAWAHVGALVFVSCAAWMLIVAAPAGADGPGVTAVPTTHTYQDGHKGGHEGSGIALWVLLGAAAGLTVIAVTLTRHGRPQPRH